MAAGERHDELKGGPITLDTLRALVERGEVDTVLVVFPDLYGRFLGKRVAGGFFLDAVADGGVHACNYLLTVDMEMEVVPGYRFANWEKGYGDCHLVPDLATLRRLSWLDRSAQVICDLEMDGRPVAVAPRTLLRRQVERAASAGYRALGASELEYYLFRDGYDAAAAKGFEGLEPFGRYLEDYHMLQGTRTEGYHGALRRHLEASGIPVESSKGEWGPGQHELNIRYCEVLEMADRHALYKQAAKEIALAQGLAVTFMAKWRSDLAGSSMHLHLSLWDAEDGRPLFPGDRPLAAAAEAASLAASDTFRWFLGGWLAHARAIAPFYAPYPTSYKRFVFQSWAPTRVAWSLDNRTAGFRVVGAGPALRIECRMPGADANPYLAFAASLAAGLDGIERRIEPPPAFSGDMYRADELPRVPASLPEAVAEMEASAMLRTAFGDEAIEHYAHFFRTEQAKLDREVTSWERQRYFERA
ncbi:MAG TPA: glutamine synthetase family protein [Thermoanaerobaculia bacterium]|nr:glutamine synthetase family protein [Thermoanaerobaculia bacterium]